MAGRRTREIRAVSVAALPDTGHAPTDRVNIQTEQALQDLQDRSRSALKRSDTADTALGVRIDTLSATVSALPGRFLARQVLTSNGTYVPTPGAKTVRVRMVGGGGGGGGAGGGGNAAAGGGGASGTFLEINIGSGAAVTGGSVTIGSAGTGGASTGGTGTSGGTTSIVINGVTYSATGGQGGTGLGSTAQGFAFPGGALGGSSSGDVTMFGPGQPGIVVSPTLFWGGSGGSSPLGGGGFVGTGSNPGNDGTGFGSGGGGASTGATNRAGGNARPGAIIVEEYS